MKSYRKELWFNVPARRGFIHITPSIEKCLAESGVREGLVLVSVGLDRESSVHIAVDQQAPHAVQGVRVQGGLDGDWRDLTGDLPPALRRRGLVATYEAIRSQRQAGSWRPISP